MDINALVTLLLGGGGTAIAGALYNLIKQRGDGKIMRDDTAIARWKEWGDSLDKELDEVKAQLAWYQLNYPSLWIAYSKLEGSETGAFPAVPPAVTITEQQGHK